MTKYALLILLFSAIKMSCFAQQYSGVNVTRIKGKYYEGEVEKPTFHRFALGVNLPRSMNYLGDKTFYWKNTDSLHYTVSIPGIQFDYSYEKGRWAIHGRIMFERMLVNKKQFGDARYIEQFTYGVGVTYKWVYKKHLQFYSGATVGFSIQNWPDGALSTNPTISSRSSYGFGSIQLIALGINYKFSNFGIFGELGYGKKGLAYFGAFYSI